jgi:hypothetical protein
VQQKTAGSSRRGRFRGALCWREGCSVASGITEAGLREPLGEVGWLWLNRRFGFGWFGCFLHFTRYTCLFLLDCNIWFSRLDHRFNIWFSRLDHRFNIWFSRLDHRFNIWFSRLDHRFNIWQA